MTEYYIHIMNWPIEADTPEEAARKAYRLLKEDPTEFYFKVTEEEIHPRQKAWNFDTNDFEEDQDDIL